MPTVMMWGAIISTHRLLLRFVGTSTASQVSGRGRDRGLNWLNRSSSVAAWHLRRRIGGPSAWSSPRPQCIGYDLGKRKQSGAATSPGAALESRREARERGRLAAGIAHDFNNLLTSSHAHQVLAESVTGAARIRIWRPSTRRRTRRRTHDQLLASADAGFCGGNLRIDTVIFEVKVLLEACFRKILVRWRACLKSGPSLPTSNRSST